MVQNNCFPNNLETFILSKLNLLHLTTRNKHESGYNDQELSTRTLEHIDDKNESTIFIPEGLSDQPQEIFQDPELISNNFNCDIMDDLDQVCDRSPLAIAPDECKFSDDCELVCSWSSTQHYNADSHISLANTRSFGQEFEDSDEDLFIGNIDFIE